MQGGPMSEQEAVAFEKSELFDTILKMRTWDDKGKIVGAKVPGLESYVPMMMKHFVNNRAKGCSPLRAN